MAAKRCVKSNRNVYNEIESNITTSRSDFLTCVIINNKIFKQNQ